MFLHGKLVFNENSPRFRAGQILFKTYMEVRKSSSRDVDSSAAFSWKDSCT